MLSVRGSWCLSITRGLVFLFLLLPASGLLARGAPQPETGQLLPVPVVSATTTPGAQAGLRFGWLWQKHMDAGGKQAFMPAIDHHAIYVNDAHTIAALSRSRGHVLWHHATVSPMQTGLVATACSVAGVSQDGVLWAWSTDTGKYLWQQTLASVSYRTPTASPRVIYAMTLNGMVYAVSACLGHLRWVAQHAVPTSALPFTSAPSFTQRWLAAAFRDQAVVLYRRDNGEKVAGFAMDADVEGGDWGNASAMMMTRSTTLLDANMLYVLRSKALIALRLPRLQPQWRNKIAPSQGMAQDAHTLYVLDKSGDLWAYNKKNGLIRWCQKAYQPLAWRTVSAAPGMVILTGAHGAISVLHADTGMLWKGLRFHRSAMRIASLGSTWVVHDRRGWVGVFHLGV